MSVLLPFTPGFISEYPGGERQHQGVDFAVPTGSPVLAAFSGTVRYSGDDGLGGLTVDVSRIDGLLCRDGHLSRSFVRHGQRVQQGDLIALTGWSGYVLPPGPSGAHLHREFRWDEQWNGGAWLNWSQIKAQGIIYPGALSTVMEDEEMLDSMYAKVNGVSSWCWMNFATGKWYAVYTQKEADYIARYQGSMKNNFSKDRDGGTQRYNDKFAFFKMLTK